MLPLQLLPSAPRPYRSLGHVQKKEPSVLVQFCWHWPFPIMHSLISGNQHTYIIRGCTKSVWSSGNRQTKDIFDNCEIYNRNTLTCILVWLQCKTWFTFTLETALGVSTDLFTVTIELCAFILICKCIQNKYTIIRLCTFCEQNGSTRWSNLQIYRAKLEYAKSKIKWPVIHLDSILENGTLMENIIIAKQSW